MHHGSHNATLTHTEEGDAEEEEEGKKPATVRRGGLPFLERLNDADNDVDPFAHAHIKFNYTVSGGQINYHPVRRFKRQWIRQGRRRLERKRFSFSLCTGRGGGGGGGGSTQTEEEAVDMVIYWSLGEFIYRFFVITGIGIIY